MASQGLIYPGIGSTPGFDPVKVANHKLFYCNWWQPTTGVTSNSHGLGVLSSAARKTPPVTCFLLHGRLVLPSLPEQLPGACSTTGWYPDLISALDHKRALFRNPSYLGQSRRPQKYNNALLLRRSPRQRGRWVRIWNQQLP